MVRQLLGDYFHKISTEIVQLKHDKFLNQIVSGLLPIKIELSTFLCSD